jgi:hypothetical protein
MINKNERETLKTVLKNNYSQRVQELLKSDNIVNKKGEPYSDGYIRRVFMGDKSNFDIEKALWKVYEERLNEHSDFNAYKQKLMEKNKAEAVTSASTN